MKTCEVCKKQYPAYLISKVHVYSREYCGGITVCDFCYVGSNDECLREYKGFDGWMRRRLRKLWEKHHIIPEKVIQT